jgi:hypothetical protein
MRLMLSSHRAVIDLDGKTVHVEARWEECLEHVKDRLLVDRYGADWAREHASGIQFDFNGSLMSGSFAAMRIPEHLTLRLRRTLHAGFSLVPADFVKPRAYTGQMAPLNVPRVRRELRRCGRKGMLQPLQSGGSDRGQLAVVFGMQCWDRSSSLS